MSYQDVSVLCGTCGSETTAAIDPGPDDLVTCIGCGQSDRFDDVLESVKQHMLREAADVTAAALSTAVRGSKSVRFNLERQPREPLRWTSTLKLEV